MLSMLSKTGFSTGGTSDFLDLVSGRHKLFFEINLLKIFYNEKQRDVKEH